MHIIYSLDVISLAALIYYKVNLQLLTDAFTFFTSIEDFHNTHINIVATNQQLVINNVLHDVSRLLLSEIQSGIAESQISEVIFQVGTDILSAFDNNGWP